MKVQKESAAELPRDVNRLLDDLRNVLASNGHDADPAASMLFSKAASTLEKVKTASANAIGQSKALALSADSYVHASPWRVVGGALAAGTLLGFALTRGKAGQAEKR
ncbi:MULTISPECIES: DUF883 family protein [Comamonas]|uniref:DUF883 family protein n=1 Tax=Comamonas TaxID=283 RepID=UPI000635B641|nr:MULTISPECIES: DUF883 family protein [Comamonas]GAO73235.1 hypothetical protein CSE6_034_46720 [Comamonas sp. E6]